MQFVFSQNLVLPKLSWLGIVDPDSPFVNIFHGTHVEAHGEFFIEGVWSGPFSAGAFETTDCIFGSGGVLKGNSVVFVSSGSTCDYLYYGTAQNRIVVSNSLPLLLCELDDCLDPQYREYHLINSSIMRGIYNYRPNIPTRKGVVHRIMYRNISIAGSSISLIDKNLPPKFGNFKDYKSYLVECCSLLGENARDPGRRHNLAIYSTQSRGFDTTAVNSIASKIGIDMVFTVGQASVPGYYVTNEIAKHISDDGSAICEHLGLPCITIDRRAFEKDLDNEYLYFASLHQFDDANMAGLYSHIDGVCVLFTGTLGIIWRHPDYHLRKFGSRYLEVMKGLFLVDLVGHGLTEIRLQSGFIHVPLPYIGAMRNEDIFRISTSREMDPWRTDGYDKPIPCRIAREAGVPRELFGQVKVATPANVAEPCIPLNPTLRNEYLDFLAANKIVSKFWRPLLRLAQLWNTPLILAKHDNRFWMVYYLTRLISKISMDKWKLPPMLISLNGSIFCFCVNKRIADYKLMMRHQGRQ